MSGKNAPAHRLESDFKTDCMKYMSEFYPKAHTVLIPSTWWRLLPYDLYVFDSVFRAIELKIDDHQVEAHQYKALFEVVENRGYAFVMRWLNQSQQIIIENFTNSETKVINPVKSARQLNSDGPLGPDDRPAKRKDTYQLALQYIMGFNVSPLESQIQEVVKRNYDMLLRKLVKVGSRTKM